MLFGLYVYLQIQQRGRALHYQISLLLLYIFATAVLVVEILLKKHFDLFVLSAVLSDGVNEEIANAHFASCVNFEYASFFFL